MAKVKKTLRIIEKRCNAFYSSEVVTRASQAPIFMIVSVTYYPGGGALGYFLGGYVPPGTPNWHPVPKKLSAKINAPF